MTAELLKCGLPGLLLIQAAVSTSSAKTVTADFIFQVDQLRYFILLLHRIHKKFLLDL